MARPLTCEELLLLLDPPSILAQIHFKKFPNIWRSSRSHTAPRNVASVENQHNRPNQVSSIVVLTL